MSSESRDNYDLYLRLSHIALLTEATKAQYSKISKKYALSAVNSGMPDADYFKFLLAYYLELGLSQSILTEPTLMASIFGQRALPDSTTLIKIAKEVEWPGDFRKVTKDRTEAAMDPLRKTLAKIVERPGFKGENLILVENQIIALCGLLMAQSKDSFDQSEACRYFWKS